MPLGGSPANRWGVLTEGRVGTLAKPRLEARGGLVTAALLDDRVDRAGVLCEQSR
jgi:hypothetical protein